MKSNRIILVILFFLIGYFLYFKDKPGPLGEFWTNVTGVFKSHSKEKSNPYKAPEPDSVATATSNNTDEASSSEEEGSLLDKLKGGKEETSDEAQIPHYALPAIDGDDEIITHENYILKYEEKYEVPAWVVHRLKGEYTDGLADRKGNQFIPDKMVENNSALSNDYSNTGYDRGHMVPAGDFKCCQEWMNETFYMSNIAPQVPDFNRGIWENIEERVRDWAVRDGELIVVTGPVLRDGLPTIGRYNTVAVPEYYYKIVLFYQPKTGKPARALAFLLPNEGLHGKRMNSFVVSVDQVEKVTGLNFFAKLPDNIENAIEAKSDWNAWTKVW